MNFFLETLVGGLLAGTLYSLVAIGFVLIYKASGVFNFAQGAMLLFAALTFVSLREQGFSFALALVLTVLVMIVGALLIERLVLRPLVNRSQITLFMATLGLSFIIEGLAQGLMGAQVRALDLGIEDVPLFVGEIMVSQFDLIAAGVSGLTVAVLALLFNKTRIGVALRAVADDTRAALSLGINLNRIWQIVWAVAGVVGLVAGLLWGARQGVQFSLSLVVLKALPVLIIGGFTSIGGAIVGGLIVGAAENLAEAYIGPLVGGGITPWFAYFLALIFLYIRPSGLFGDRIIERV
ncbi:MULTISPECIES: branched-chain amino acid ABC transporter permease [Pseudomonas]|jgi:branched-chain amino acid transport system permease protein|uniref:Branched-chain amino acid ABC transporter permease n=1 Tax=Pseudomonas canavaninivorans TaxID=2842348 RepID=A0ABX8Q7W7_PSECO|nr:MULTISPECIES: branched-chain amino acid ABC transporter permease [Pseudomonas]MBJ2345336.1 branched-chain amino acid ABC transporter permease [Pseudomonas canavaninivorans]MBL3541426.1 branched-chain amino acid ABC transporter permease [Pseudomonas sp. HB05]MCL6701570.1 branched-chain amino acid ABC transporter permease [Pseudomonas sp. T1.Ur]QXI51300.1 branched-chain amino acid ABC transporter permease [Pseudomonas alvandae]UVM70245.1 branched-chain amino acid ABC transporter permease [Pse